MIDTDMMIYKLFLTNWNGDHVLGSLANMKAQLYKTLKDQTNGYWSGHTAYHIAVHGGFLLDGESGTHKSLTSLGEMFMVDYENKMMRGRS